MALIANNLRDTKLHLTLRIIVIAQGTDNNSKSKLYVLILKLRCQEIRLIRNDKINKFLPSSANNKIIII